MKADDGWQKALRCAQSALDKKAYDLVVLDVEALTSIASYFVICTGRSDIQVQTISQAIEDALRQAGHRPLALEGVSHGQWVLMDFGDVIVHIFYETVREFYNLEGTLGQGSTLHAARTLLDASPGPPTRNRLGAFSLAPRRPTFPFFPSGFPFILGEGTSERTSLGDAMGRTASTQETLYYGSTRKHQYWENEKQTLRLVRDRAASVWRAYRKQHGMYRLLLVKSRSTARTTKRETEIDTTDGQKR